MAVPTISISGSVLTPSGDAPTSGRFTIKLSTAGSVTDTDTGAVVRVATEETVDLTAGAIAVSLVPNESITPTGTYYLVSAICVMPSGRRVQWSEKWQLAASPVTIDIGSVPRTDIQAGVAASHVGDWPAQAAAQVASAAAYAASAAEDAAAADAWAAQAETSAAAAAVSALAASSISGIYADTTAGLAATASGSYFYTVSTDPYVLILYLDNAGTAVEQGRVPAATAVQALQRALTPEATDTAGGLVYICDAAGRVIAYWDSSSGLRLYGRPASVQTKLAELDAYTQQAGTGSDLHQFVDAAGVVVGRIDSTGGLRLAGLDDTVQASCRVTQNEMLWRPPGSVVLPSGFTPMTKTLRGQERYVWSGSPPALRPNQTRFTAYPFYWNTDPVPYTSVRRVRSNLTAPDVHNWSYESVTVTGIPSGKAFRDISWLYDRATATYYYAINNIDASLNATDFAIYSSSDGLAITYVGSYGGITGSPTRVWSPEFFVDDDGTVYVIISANTETGGAYAYHLFQCANVAAFDSWTYLGKLTGSAFPTTSGGAMNMIDPYLLQRDGVYYVVWKCEVVSGGSHELGRLGIAWSTSILGPYDSGQAFTDPTPTDIKGEGPCVVELPQGSAYRFRLFFDNYLGVAYGGITTGYSVYADTNDFTTFTVPAKTYLSLTNYSRHFTACVGD